MESYALKITFKNTEKICNPSTWGIQNIDKPLSYKIGEGIESLINTILQLPGEEIKITCLDLKIQGSSILQYLISNKFIQFVNPTEYYFNKSLTNVEAMPMNIKKFFKELTKYKYFHASIGNLGQWYSIDIYYKDEKIKKSIRFVDIQKVLIGCGYKELRTEFLGLEYKVGSFLDNLKMDVETLGLSVKELNKYGIIETTAASAALNNFKKTLKEQYKEENNSKINVFDTLFPKLKIDEVNFSYRAYRGGFCYLNPIYKERSKNSPFMKGDIMKGIVADANSLYSYVMKKYPLPVGKPYKIYSEYEYNILSNNLVCESADNIIEGNYTPPKVFIVDFLCSFKLKEDGLPFLQLKPNDLKREYNFLNEIILPTDEQLLTSDGQIVNLTMTNIDLELFYHNYEVDDFTFIEASVYEAFTGIFEDYIDFWYSKKKEAKKTHNKPLYIISKMMLNSLSGKFGAKPYTKWKIPILNKDVLGYTYTSKEENNTIYMPMAAFITSYARKYLFEKIEFLREFMSCRYINFDCFMYTDTDSIHCLMHEQDMKDLINLGIIGGEEIGDFKIEEKIYKARYIRQKTYLLQVVSNDNIEKAENPYKVVCSGLPKEAQKEVNFDNFSENSVFEGKKEVYKQVKGGMVRVKENFCIKGDILDEED